MTNINFTSPNQISEEESVELAEQQMKAAQANEQYTQQVRQETQNPTQPSPQPSPQPSNQQQPQNQQQPSEQPQPTEEKEDEESNPIKDAVKVVGENAAAIPLGILDFGVDVTNKISGNNYKIPKFENDFAQGLRQLTKEIGPEIGAFIFTRGKLKGISKGLQPGLRAGNRVQRAIAALGDSKAFQFISTLGLEAGVGVGVNELLPERGTDDNLLGAINKASIDLPEFLGGANLALPESMKFPEWLATTDLDSPDLKRSKNRLESAGLPLGFGFLEALFRTFKGQRAIAKATKWIPENEKSKAFIDRQNVLKNEKLSNDPVEDVILKAAEREEQQLDALGLQGISRQVDPSKPIKGVHDAFEMGELGTITAPTLSQAVMEGMTDVARIYNNKGTIQGRVGSVFTEAALGMLDFNARTQRLMVKTVSKIMNEADKFAAEIPEVGKLTAKQIDEAGEWIAAKAIDPAMGVEELREFFQPFKAGNTKDSVAYISDVGYVGAMKTIKKLGEDLYNMDIAKARGLIDASFAGQVADMAGVAVEYSDDVLVERAQELIIERIKYLSTEKGIASAAAGRALSLKKLITNPNRLSPNDLVDTAKEIKSNLKEDALIEVRSADQLELTLKSVAKERPDLMHTFMMAYDATDGRVHSITDLNDYIQNSTGFIRKLIIDKNTDIPSQFKLGSLVLAITLLCRPLRRL